MVLNHEKKGDYPVNPGISPLKDELQFQKWQNEKFFSQNQSINVLYPIEENVFMVPNHENKGDYYVNPCLSKSTDIH